MLAYHIIRAPAEDRTQDLPLSRRALNHWATVHLVCSIIVCSVTGDFKTDLIIIAS